MSTEQNKASIRHLSEAINTQNYRVLPELFAPHYIGHFNPDIKGPDGVKQSFMALRIAFPDYHEKIGMMLAEGDLVAVAYTIEGTFTGKSGDIAPTGRHFSMPWIVIARFENGKQVEAWQYGDNLAYYRQLGIPVPPA